MTATTIRVQMAQRKDTAAGWTAANPILLLGEIGYETDAKKFKIGDGTTNWNSLAYLPIPDVSGNLTITGNLEIGSTGTLTFEGSTADGFETTLAVTDPTADRTITLPDVTGTVITSGDTGSVTSTMLADGTIVNADINAAAEIAVSKLANGTANQVLVTDGTDVSWSDNLTLAGDLTVNGTTTTINTQDLLVEDKNIIIGNVDTPTDVTADGGGITLKGSTDKTINWVDATDAWTLSENVNIASGKEYRIDGTKVLDATSLGGAVVSSSLTSVGTIATGTWQGSAIDAAYLDSTIVTTGDTGTVTSTMIADGTIVDGDVNASAAIAGTKISPDFGSQNVTTTGTSTAASFIPTSSTVPTNGVYLPAANSVALSTSSSERIRIGANGEIGLSGANYGTSGQVLTSAGSGAAPTWQTPTATTDKIEEGNTSAEVIDTGSDGRFVVTTEGTERLRVTDTGLVGIGTSSAQDLLHVEAGNGGGITISRNSITDNEYSDQDFVYRSGGTYYWTGKIRAIKRSGGGGDFQFFTSSDGTEPSAPAVVIDQQGRLAIGTTNASGANVVIDTESNGGSGIRLIGKTANDGSEIDFYADNNSTRLGYIEYNNANTTFNSETNVPVRFYQNGGEAFRVDTNKRLLVGTSTARTAWNNTQTGANIIQVERDGDGNSAAISITANSGTATPTSPIGAAARLLLGRTRGTSVGSTVVVAANDVLGDVSFQGSDGAQQVEAATITAYVDGTPGSNDMPGRLVFSTTSDSASSPTERLRITSDAYVRLASGTGGIQFNGDTAAANALDDYEEGTWTPTLGGTATYSTQVGIYTKIGRLVSVSFDIAVSTLGTGSTNSISGLPFTVSISPNGESRGATGYFASLATNVIALTCYANSGTSSIKFISMNASGGTATINPAIFGNSARVQGSVVYIV